MHRHRRATRSALPAIRLFTAVLIALTPVLAGASPSPASSPLSPASSGGIGASSSELPTGSALPGATSSAPAGSPDVGASPSEQAPAASRPLVFAYYYIWYTPTSWRRAKADLPELGSYDSRDRAVIAQHIAWAKSAGIDGLIVSWKHETRLDAALRILVDEAAKANFKLILLYQGLDFDRLPLDPAKVAGDLQWFLETYAKSPPFDIYGLPTIVWSGTWGYKDGQIAQVRRAIGAPGRALLLGSEKSAAAYTARATLFDGDAYYWSSPDPLSTPGYQRRLNDLAAAVRTDGGRWIAPAAPGFDARAIGGTSIVDRRDGATFKAAVQGALKTTPDVLGIISWNEFSENSYIEPSKTYGDRYLQLTKEVIGSLPSAGSGGSGGSGGSAATAAPAPVASVTIPAGSSIAPPASRTDGASAAPAAFSIAAGGAIIVVLVFLGRRLRRRTSE